MLMCLSVLGLVFNIFGTFLVGFISQGGIPKKGQTIKAPNRCVAFLGWVAVLIGFIFQLFGLFLQK